VDFPRLTAALIAEAQDYARRKREDPMFPIRQTRQPPEAETSR
jgi:hypothetical protein